MSDELKVLGVAGSLRRGSFNAAALRAAGELLPAGMTLEIFDLAPIPLYNADVDAAGQPESVIRLKQAIGAADAILIATPEYNYSVSGVLKNAIDWASRPPAKTPFHARPVAIMGASSGLFGTVRAQVHLRQILQSNNALVMPKPEVHITQAAGKFDDAGRLADETTRAHITKFLAALAEWARRHRTERAAP